MFLRKFHILLLCSFFIPSLCFAQSIFSGREDDDVKPNESALLNSIFGKPVENPNARWERFKSLQEYGLSGQVDQSSNMVPDPKEEETLNQYYQSKDPFSTSERMGRVQDLQDETNLD